MVYAMHESAAADQVVSVALREETQREARKWDSMGTAIASRQTASANDALALQWTGEYR
ncbi:MAG TPA: hypothetical protein VF573_10220 [Paraburkholderia sp.]|uniref:hypothetical protein n=1 Tax=Paraburkholderia sp. TaxID=1926495 RepID=UPI002ED2F83C